MIYRVLHEGILVGHYKAQRPNVAANKAFTQVLKTLNSKECLTMVVESTTCHAQRSYKVCYESIAPNAFGILKRPKATRL